MLRPIDIQNKEFEKKIKGYACEAVDDFLDVVIQDFEQLYKENTSLKERIAVLTETVERYKNMENTLRKSLDVAKQTADDIKKNAEIEARSIIGKAELDASNLLKQLDDKRIKKQQHLIALKAELDTYKARVKALCENNTKMADTF